MLFVFILTAYLLFVWFGLRLIVPHLGFKKTPLPETIPADFDAVITSIVKKSKSDGEFLEHAYEYVILRATKGAVSKPLLIFG